MVCPDSMYLHRSTGVRLWSLVLTPSMLKRNLSKPFSIAGLVFGELYMLAFVFAPSKSGEIVPMAHQFWRIVSLAPFCGIFGALMGMGVGLLVSAMLPPKE